MSASTGFPAAQYRAGMYYMNGEGTEKNTDKAIRWFKKAILQKHEDASVQLPLLLTALGRDSEAYRWERKVDDWSAGAMCAIGDRCLSGRGVVQDTKLALEWYEKAFAHGLSSAAIKIGDLFAEGADGIDHDVALARKWYLSAAVKNELQAYRQLAELELDEGDLYAAYKWYVMGSKRGCQYCSYRASTACINANEKCYDEAAYQHSLTGNVRVYIRACVCACSYACVGAGVYAYVCLCLSM